MLHYLRFGSGSIRMPICRCRQWQRCRRPSDQQQQLQEHDEMSKNNCWCCTTSRHHLVAFKVDCRLLRLLCAATSFIQRPHSRSAAAAAEMQHCSMLHWVSCCLFSIIRDCCSCCCWTGLPQQQPQPLAVVHTVPSGCVYYLIMPLSSTISRELRLLLCFCI